MKFFIGFISATVIIALTLTGVYAYKELKPNDNDSAQTKEQNNQLNETPTQQTDNEQTAPAEQENTENVEQTAPSNHTITRE
ncbi:hypothetical protein [Staphylococcus sp. Mo2-1]